MKDPWRFTVTTVNNVTSYSICKTDAKLQPFMALRSSFYFQDSDWRTAHSLADHWPTWTPSWEEVSWMPRGGGRRWVEKTGCQYTPSPDETLHVQAGCSAGMQCAHVGGKASFLVWHHPFPQLTLVCRRHPPAQWLWCTLETGEPLHLRTKTIGKFWTLFWTRD